MIALWLVLAAGGSALLLLAWVVYPAISERRAAARRDPPPRPLAPPVPSVSVVLVTRDPAAQVRARLGDLLRTTYPLERLEVIVAIDGAMAGDELLDRPDRFSRFVLTRSDAPGGKACGLNSAVREARGDVLVFTDSQQRFEPEAIERLVTALHGGPWSAVSGALHLTGVGGTGNLLTRYWERERRLREAEARVHSSVGVTGAIYAMRRDRWSPLPAGLILDDLYVPMRLVLGGDRVGFEAGAIATDERVTQPAQEFRRKVRTLTGNLQLCAWLPGVLSPRANPIWFSFVCHKLLRLLTPYAVAGIAIGLLGLWVSLAPSTLGVLFALLGLVLLFALFGRNRLSRQLRSAGIWALTMQAAAVVAMLNGVRGNWKVWHPPSEASGAGP